MRRGVVARDDLRRKVRDPWARTGSIWRHDQGVVDLERGILLLDADLHADQEASLLADDSMVNLRPSSGNRSRGVDDPVARAAIAAFIGRVVRR